MAETEYGKFAQERSHNDSKNLAEYGKIVLQMVIGINGLAATALITLAAATKDTAITTLQGNFVDAIRYYLGGVACGILSSIFLYASAQYWVIRWEQAAYPNMTEAKKARRKGIIYHWCALVMSILGLVLFVVGGYSAVTALKAYKATITHPSSEAGR
jgi:hypothetical protein